MTALLVVIGVLGVFAWRQGGDGGGGPLNAIAEAAVKTQSESGGRAAVRAIVSSPTLASFAISGQAVFNAEGRSRMVLSVPRPPEGDPFGMEEVVDGTTVYMHSSKFGMLPGGKRWMKLDLALGENLDTQLPANADAKGQLALLESVTGKVQELGKEDVHGVPTTRYRGTITVAKQAQRLREEGGGGVASVVEKKGSPMHVEAWIGADGLVRRMGIVQSQPSEGADGDTTIDMKVDYFDFGLEPQIEVPESSEVFDATSEARSNLGLSNDE